MPPCRPVGYAEVTSSHSFNFCTHISDIDIHQEQTSLLFSLTDLHARRDCTALSAPPVRLDVDRVFREDDAAAAALPARHRRGQRAQLGGVSAPEALAAEMLAYK